jgi:dolichyl-phosphate-mannose-protein mannosyltransferase
MAELRANLPTRRSLAAQVTPAVAVPVVVWIGSALYLWLRLDRGWYPWDEGALAEPAQRILNGGLPHRDFVDAYTGALSYLHAGAFLLFGRELTSLRLVLFAFFVAWVPALYYVASRFLRPLEAGAVCLAAVAWSVPNYSASMPSWYCTFLATFAVAALLRQLEVGGRRWLVVAGVCAGVSITVKIVGVYFVAAALVYFAFKASSDRRHGTTRSRQLWSIGVGLGGAALSAALLVVLRANLSASVVVNFAVPVVALACFAFVSARAGEKRGTASVRSFVTLAAPFVLGVAIPVAAFAVPYAASGALGDLVRGVWAPSTRMMTLQAKNPPSVLTLFAFLPLVPVFFVPSGLRNVKPWERAAPVAVLLALGLAFSGRPIGYLVTWQSLRAAIPILTVGGVIALHRRRNAFTDPGALQRVVLLLAATAMCSLVQYPFSAPVYFTFIAPLVILAGAALITVTDLVPRQVLWLLIAFYLVFGVVRLNGSSLYDVGSRYRTDGTMQKLALQRGGLDVPRDTALEYEQVIGLVQKHAGGSKYTYATPDAPEVYFLSGLENPTTTMFEYLDAYPPNAPLLMQTLAQRRVNVVVINLHPPLSPPASPAIRAALQARYPNATLAGAFEVRWRS